MQHAGLDKLAAQHGAAAVYLYVPKAFVKRKGFNLEWSDKSEGVATAQEKLEASGLLVEGAVDVVSQNSKTLMCCITVPDVDKSVQVMSGDFAKSITDSLQGSFSGKVVKWKSAGQGQQGSTAHVALLLIK